MRTPTRIVSVAAMVASGLVAAQAGASPLAIGVNFADAAKSNTTMSASTPDVAGVGSARLGPYNNIEMPDGTGSGTLSTVTDTNGNTLAGTTVTVSGSQDSYQSAGPSTNDAQLYYNEIDVFNGAATITVTDVPYSSYTLDVFVYNDTGNPGRGGSVTVGGTTYYIATGTSNTTQTGIGNPTSSGSGYVQSTDTTSANDLAAVGNYVEFDNLTGSTLSVSLSAINTTADDNVPRLKVAGFEIVDTAAPEPAGLGLIAMAGNFLLCRRRRRSTGAIGR